MSADVIAWLRSEAGEQWSRIAHHGGSVLPEDAPQTPWGTGALDTGSDPCGSGPVKTSSEGEQ